MIATSEPRREETAATQGGGPAAATFSTTRVILKVHTPDFCIGHKNQFVFCGDDPVNRRDPFGLTAMEDALINSGVWDPYPNGQWHFDSQGFSDAVESRRFDNIYVSAGNLANAGANALFRYPRAGLGSHAAGYPSTWLSALGSKVPIRLPFRALGTRNAFRLLGRVAILPLILEGFYDWGTMGYAFFEHLSFEPLPDDPTSPTNPYDDGPCK